MRRKRNARSVSLPTSSFSASGVLTKSTVIHLMGESSASSSSPSLSCLGRIKDGRAFPKTNVDFLSACIVAAKVSGTDAGKTARGQVSSSLVRRTAEQEGAERK